MAEEINVRTIILPGFSVSNREWAYDLKEKLGDMSIIVHEWRHWQEGGSLALYYELDKILKKVAKEKINILAKSVGTRVAMNLIQKIPKQINKVILCGIPSLSEAYNYLSNFPARKVIVFQNTKDPLGNFSEVEEFIHRINKDIKVVEMPRNDHSYPYPSEFSKFLH